MKNGTRFFYKQRFFSTHPVLPNFFMNSASDIAFELLIAHNYHHTETHFIFSKFVTMSWPSAIYVVSTTMFLS